MDSQSTQFESTIDGVLLTVIQLHQAEAELVQRSDILRYKDKLSNQFISVAQEKERLLRDFGILNRAAAEFKLVITNKDDEVVEMMDDQNTYDYSGQLCSDAVILQLRER